MEPHFGFSAAGLTKPRVGSAALFPGSHGLRVECDARLMVCFVAAFKVVVSHVYNECPGTNTTMSLTIVIVPSAGISLIDDGKRCRWTDRVKKPE